MLVCYIQKIDFILVNLNLFHAFQIFRFISSFKQNVADMVVLLTNSADDILQLF